MKTFSIPGGLAGPPSACSAAPDRLDVFAVRPGGIVSRWSWDGTGWTQGDLPPSGGVIPAEGVCAVSSGPGRVEVFAVEARSRTPLWWRGNGTLWSYAGSLPSGRWQIPDVPVAAVCASPDSIDVFAVGSDKTPWWWHWEGSIGWNNHGSLPGGDLPAVRIAAVSPAPGRLDVFAVGRNKNLWHWWRSGGGAWSKEDLGGNLPAVGVSAVSWGPNRIDVFAVGSNTHLQHWSSDGTSFAGPEDLGGSLAAGTVSAVSHAPHRLDVFAISGDKRIAQWQWDGQGWTGPDYRGDNIPAGDVSAVVRKPHRLDVFVTGAGNTLRQWPGGGLESVRNKDWENWPTTHQKSAPPGILRPDSLEELVNIVKAAEQANLGVRAVGTGWSSSDVAVSPGYVVETDLLGAVLTDVLTTSLNANSSGLPLVHVEAGIKLDKLVARLSGMKLELKTLGGSTGQSLAGAVSTSVHGMDVKLSPLPDMVRAIHLVGPGGVQHWIEPRRKIITEPIHLKAALGLADENIHYDDDWFYSVLVSMGSMGIIYSYVIEVDQQYDLIETRRRFDWTEMKAMLVASDSTNPLAVNHRGVQIVVSPYSPGGSRDCYLTTRLQAVPTEAAPPGTDYAWLVRDLTPILFSTWRTDRSTVDEFIIDATEKQQAGPRTTRGLAHTLSGGADPGGVRGIGLEVVFDANSPAYLDFVDAALEIIRAAYYDSDPKPWSYLGWISLRFQGRSDAYLSPQQSNLNCTVEFAAAYRRPELPGVGWADTPLLLARIEEEARRRGAIQHWGMNASINANDVARAYPRLDTWRRVRWELTKGGTITTFDSEFTRRCGLSAPPIGHADLTTLTGAPGAAGSPIATYSWEAGGSKQVVYVTGDGHIHELSVSVGGGWNHADLTALTGAPSAAAGSPIAAYGWEAGGSKQVVYVTDDGHIHELSVSVGGGWNHADLTALTGAPSAAAGSPIAAYGWEAGGSKQLVYVTGDGHIHELVVGMGAGWSHADLTAIAGAPSAAGSPIAAYGWEAGDSKQVVYITGDGHIHELVVGMGAGWSHADLTAIAGAPSAAGSPIAAYGWEAGDSKQVVYITSDGHIHELSVSVGASWSHADLTTLTGAPGAAGSPIAAYGWEAGDSKQVVYITGDDHIHELWVSVGGGWNHTDLTAFTGAPGAAGSPIAAYSWEVGLSKQVVYLTGNGHIHELLTA